MWPGAYDANGDSFPIMDVNSNRAPWVRVEPGDPVRAMRTFDTVANRLYLPVSEAGTETDGSGRYGRRLRAAPGMRPFDTRRSLSRAKPRGRYSG